MNLKIPKIARAAVMAFILSLTTYGLTSAYAQVNNIQTVKIKNVEIGKDAPKILVPIMPKNLQAIENAVAALKGVELDIIEWRVDHFDEPNNAQQVQQAAQLIRQQITQEIGDVPLLFTFRTAKEGGEKDISTQDYVALNLAMIESGLVDAVDVELFTGDEHVKTIIAAAHAKGIKVIASSHDFEKTPSKEEMISRLRKMQALGADIPKIAVMPQNKSDVLTLLAATLEMHEQYANRPIITMSMGAMGGISRVSGETFGSAATFGAAGKTSAPGQFEVTNLRTVLDIFHNAQ